MNGLPIFWENLKQSPRSLWRTIFRHGRPESDRTRSEAVFHNLFLHLHATAGRCARASPWAWG